MGLIILVLLTLFVAGPQRDGAEILVRRDDDLKKVLGKVQPGDIVVLQDGEWKDVPLRLEVEGSEKESVMLRAETPGKVLLTGGSTLQISGSHITVSGLMFDKLTGTQDVIEFRTHSERLAHHCRVTNCAIIGEDQPDEKSERKWISIYGTENRVDHCFIGTKQTRGTTLVVWVGQGNNQHRIDNNHFGHRPPLGRNGGETIRIGDSESSMMVSQTLVARNLFERCDGEAEIVSNKSCENVYRGNTFRQCSGALTLRHGNRCRVEANYFLGDDVRGSGGVRIVGQDHVVVNNYFADLTGDESRSAISMMNGLVDSPLHGYFRVENAVVAFNTIVDCKVAMAIGVEGGPKQPLAPKNCILANNVLIGRRNEVRQHAEPENWREAGTIRAASPIELSFAQDASDVWRPIAESSVIGSADRLWIDITRDIDGDTRQEPFDAGCDQRSPTPGKPLQALNVGPDWLAPENRVRP